MHILICAATHTEIEPLLSFLKEQTPGGNHVIRVLVTGVGGIATTYNITKAIQAKKPDYIIQAGMAGAFNPEMEPGKVVLVYEEIIGDMGAVENGAWKDMFDLGLVSNDFPFIEKKLINPYCEDWSKYGLSLVRSLSVNEINTDSDRIKLLREKYVPVVESMEGAAFHYVCLHEKIPFMQIRAVSNHIGERNKANWKMDDAIANLNAELKRIILSLP